MVSFARVSARLSLCLTIALLPLAARAQIDVLTERYDDARSGANLAETQLTTANVNVDDFGKLWSYTVSGSVYAQPLYVRSVTIDGTPHNVLYVATMNNHVYAFDADSDQDTPLIDATFGDPIPIIDILGYNDNIIGNVGIESTPVIDAATDTMYFVTRSRGTDCGGANPTFCQYLHAVDITTLAEHAGSPVVIGGTVACHSDGSGNGCGQFGTHLLTFDSKIHDQRSSLALSNGRVFIAWSSHSDQFAYHGWVMAYDATTLSQNMIWSAAPDGTGFNGAGVWMAGRAPTIDADGNVYYVTGNGTWDGTSNYGESFVKFGATPDAPLLDFFTPSSYGELNNEDLDLAGSGPILIPGTDLIISGGKGGEFYLTHTTDLGQESPNDINIVQEWNNSLNGNGHSQIKGGPVYWNRDGGVGPWMYVWSDGCNHFNAYRFNGTDFDTAPPASQSTALSPCGSSGGVLTLSANGSAVGTGVVWASIPVAGDANSGIHSGMLRAFDADDLSTELWNSNQNSDRDNSGNWPKFSPPTVVNGRVYLGSFPDDGFGDTKVNVYGLLAGPAFDFTIDATPPNPGINPGGGAKYTIDVAATSGAPAPVHIDAGSLPDGVSASFDANDVTPPASVTMTLDVDASVAPGEYPLAITAASGATSHEADVGFFVTNAAPGAGVIGVDLKGNPANGISLAAADFAGVLARPNWNEIDGTSGSAQALVDESGVDTGATIDWTTSGFELVGISGPTGDFAMMNTAFDADGATTTVTVHGLASNAGGYYVYVYADGANDDADATATYAIESSDGTSSTATITDAAGATFAGTYVAADASSGDVGNYAILFASGPDFTLTVSGGSHAPLNGMQIVAAGERIFRSGFDP